jgi:hypothetical protein
VLTGQRVIQIEEAHVKVVEIKQKIIRTRTDYSQPYRFRLWVALVEDMALLGMGYRAYCSHIFESYRAWKAQGIEFRNAKGGTLILDALTQDDLYGFLGKTEQAPIGPKRKIELSKFSVLDAFFQVKYPTLAASFEVDTPILELVSIFHAFFSKEITTNYSEQDLLELHESIDGIYFPKPRISIAELRRAMQNGETYKRTIPIFIVNSGAGKRYCVVHRVEFPLHSNYLRVETSEQNMMSLLRPWLERHKPSETVIHSGIGLIAPSEFGSKNPSLACILRDRVLYRPCLTNLAILRTDIGDIDETEWVISGAIESSWQYSWMGYRFCKSLGHYATMRTEVSYSADFINDIFEMKNQLGLEV